MSVIIRLQNLPWSANALDIRNFFRGLSIPEGGVHIVGGELGDAFIAFSTDEDARQAMMLDGGKIKEIQVKLLLSSRSEMHKVIETARQTVPLLSLAPPPPVVTPAPAPMPPPVAPVPPPPPVLPAVITPFSAALGNNTVSSFGIPGIGNPQEIPQPAVIELPPAHVSPTDITIEEEKEEDKIENKRREKERRRSRTRSRSRDRERKDRKRDRRDRSRSRERRRRERSRSREVRRERKRDRKERSRSRDRSPPRRSRDRRKSPSHSQEKDSPIRDAPQVKPFGNPGNLPLQLHQMLNNPLANVPMPPDSPRYNDPTVADTMNKMQELVKKRNPNAFQGDMNNGKQQGFGRGGLGRGGSFQRRSRFGAEETRSRFGPDEPHRECCVAIRNAPNHTSYGDVRRFFPFIIDKHGIKMINDNTGRRTGNIFVRFIEGRSKQLALQRKNNELKGAHVLVEDLDDEAYEAAVDSYLPYRDDNDDDVALVAEMQERARPPFTVLKLADMPHYVKELDIIKAFNDYSLLSITLTEDRIARSKTALLQFAKADEARLAFDRKERFAFGRRHPTITALTDEEFEKEKNSVMISKNEIMNIPEEQPPAEPTPPRDPRQRRQQFDNGAPQQQPQGPPFFVQPFQSPNFSAGQNPSFPAQTQAFPPGGQFPVPQFGGFPGPGNMDPRTAATNWANRPPFPDQLPAPIKAPPHQPPKDMDDEPLDCVLMKGLPRDATDRTIVAFLSDTGAVPARIHLMLDGNGQPSGDCFCEFRSTQEARLAAGKHGKNLDGCRVTVDIVPRSVVEEALEGPKPIENPMQESIINNVPPQFFDMPRGGFNNRGSFRGRGGFDRGGYDRGGFNSRGFESRGSYRGRGGFDRGRGGFEGRGRGRGRGGQAFENGGGRNDDHDPALEDFGAPGCVVSMENVPFRATLDEIMQFFSEFELTQDDIIRRFNERGQPTGDARVAFRTPFDAQRAVKTRHMDNIHDRRINLNII